MFFPERIVSIKTGHRVLEVGPGGKPHPRSDVLLEYKFDKYEEQKAQRGHVLSLRTKKQLIYYRGECFPFGDKTFDYVICSHVLEHIVDVELFVSELCRVAPQGYIEYPTIYYDYLYNIPEHLTFIKNNRGQLVWMPKSETRLTDFVSVQALFQQSLTRGYGCLIDQLKSYFIEGYEWKGQLSARRTTQVQDLVCIDIDLPNIPQKKALFALRLKRKMRKLLNLSTHWKFW